METTELAKANNIELVTTALIGKNPAAVVADFVIDEKKHELVSCPTGQSPLRCQYKVTTDSYHTHFNKSHCMICPHRKRCGVIFQKKTALIRISRKTILRAHYLKKMSEARYKQIARQRNISSLRSGVDNQKTFSFDHFQIRIHREQFACA